MGSERIRYLFIAKQTCLRCSLAFVVYLWSTPSPVIAADYLTGSGCSVSNIGYLTDLAKEYEKRTGVKVLVRGGGSVIGIEDLRNGKVDFAAACRPKTAADPEEVSFIQVAWDALVFIVHPSNSIKNITLEEARGIYEGRITDWRQLTGQKAPVKVFISRSKKGLSGVEASTKSLVLKNNEPAESDHTVFVASSGIVEQMVETTAEGFAATGYTSARKRAVRMLKLNGIYPTTKNIIQKKYPLKRPLYILIPKNPKPAVKKFVDFVLSKDGQQFIQSLNVISLLDIK